MELQLQAAYDAGVAAASTEGSAENRQGESMLEGVCRQLDDIKLEE